MADSGESTAVPGDGADMFMEPPTVGAERPGGLPMALSPVVPCTHPVDLRACTAPGHNHYCPACGAVVTEAPVTASFGGSDAEG